MDILQIVEALSGTPMAAILLYLLIREMNAHEKTREASRESERAWVDRLALIAQNRADKHDEAAELLTRLENLAGRGS